MSSKYLTVAEVSKFIGRTPQTIRRWDRAGLLPFTPVRDDLKARLFTEEQCDVLKDFADTMAEKKANGGRS